MPTELISEDGDLAWQARTTSWGSTAWNRNATAYTPLRYPGGRLQAAGFEAVELELTLAAAQTRLDETPASAKPATPRVDCALFAADGDPRVLGVEFSAPAGRLAFEQDNVAAAEAEIHSYTASRVGPAGSRVPC